MSTIKELRDLLDHATPGEWTAVNDGPHWNNKNINMWNVYHGTDKESVVDQVIECAYTEANASLIATSRNTLPALLDLIEEMAGTLNEIATSKHQAYTDGPYISEHDSGYKMGVADGHRYCAKVAGKALAAYEKMKGE